MGRPKTGKRSNPDYEQASIYIRKDTHRALKHRALDEERDVSDVLQELAAGWIDGRIAFVQKPQAR
jgi:hypothetical protein